MGTYKSKGIKVDAEKMPILEEEVEYIPKTRSPMPSSWKLNLLRGAREDECKDRAMPKARRRCIRKVQEFHKCEKEEGQYMTVFNCQESYQAMAQCFVKQLEVEMDKERTDLTKNNEWWWKDLYDENGEIGLQKEWKNESWIQLLLNRLQAKYSTYTTSQETIQQLQQENQLNQNSQKHQPK